MATGFKSEHQDLSDILSCDHAANYHLTTTSALVDLSNKGYTPNSEFAKKFIDINQFQSWNDINAVYEGIDPALEIGYYYNDTPLTLAHRGLIPSPNLELIDAEKLHSYNKNVYVTGNDNDRCRCLVIKSGATAYLKLDGNRVQISIDNSSYTDVDAFSTPIAALYMCGGGGGGGYGDVTGGKETRAGGGGGGGGFISGLLNLKTAINESANERLTCTSGYAGARSTEYNLDGTAGGNSYIQLDGHTTLVTTYGGGGGCVLSSTSNSTRGGSGGDVNLLADSAAIFLVDKACKGGSGGSGGPALGTGNNTDDYRGKGDSGNSYSDSGNISSRNPPIFTDELDNVSPGASLDPAQGYLRTSWGGGGGASRLGSGSNSTQNNVTASKAGYGGGGGGGGGAYSSNKDTPVIELEGRDGGSGIIAIFFEKGS